MTRTDPQRTEEPHLRLCEQGPSPFSAPPRLHAETFCNNAAMPYQCNCPFFWQTHALGNWSLLLLLLVDGLQSGSSICAVKGVQKFELCRLREGKERRRRGVFFSAYNCFYSSPLCEAMFRADIISIAREKGRKIAFFFLSLRPVLPKRAPPPSTLAQSKERKGSNFTA